jgi:hypothetical protein
LGLPDEGFDHHQEIAEPVIEFAHKEVERSVSSDSGAPGRSACDI